MQDNVKKSSDKNVRRDRFIRIAEYRVNKILDCLDNLGKCSNKRNYAYSGNEVRSGMPPQRIPLLKLELKIV